jgi:hypothetical protein
MVCGHFNNLYYIVGVDFFDSGDNSVVGGPLVSLEEEKINWRIKI